MKKWIFTFFALSSSLFVNAQLSITNNQTATQLATTLVATAGNLGVTVTNPVLTCDSLANGELSGSSNFGINNGIVLSSGFVNADTANGIIGLNGLPSFMSSDFVGTPGDSMLEAIVAPHITYDACVLEFDIQPVGNFMEFEYVFGSEEYPEFNCSSFNDVFGFYISGPGFANATNIALIPNTAIPVSINSINDGSGGPCSIYQNLYVNNTDTTNSMDGFTTPLIAHVSVTPSQVYHLKLAISDVSDGILNSFVILKANSLKSGNTTPSSVNNIANEAGLTIYPTEMDNTLYIQNTINQGWKIEIIGMDGIAVYRNQLSSQQSKSSFDVSGLSKGIYLLKMTSELNGKVVVEKIIKQ
jgi:hypothetical protein